MRLPFGFKGYVNVRSCTRFERTRHACGVIDTIFRNSVIFLRFFFIFIFIFITLCCSVVRVSSFLSRRSSFYLFIYISFFTRKFKTTNNFFFFFPSIEALHLFVVVWIQIKFLQALRIENNAISFFYKFGR